MATEESMTITSFSAPTLNDGDDELDNMPTTLHLLMSELDDEDEDEPQDVSRAMSLLSLNSPAAADNDDDDDDDDDADDGVRRVSRSILIRRDSRRVNRRQKATSCKERFANRGWEMWRCDSGEARRGGLGNPEGDLERLECRLMVRPHGRQEGIPMDMEEVKACRDLGLSLPRDWTVEISGGGDTSSGGSSPMSDWCISSPGDSPKDIKARLKVWAQAVALASTSHLGN